MPLHIGDPLRTGEGVVCLADHAVSYMVGEKGWQKPIPLNECIPVWGRVGPGRIL